MPAPSLAQVERWETYRLDPEAFSKGTFTDKHAEVSDLIRTVPGGLVTTVLPTFQWYPAFLLTAFLGYAVSRWRDFINVSYCMMGRCTACCCMP